jgi:hypothetical protein
MSVAAKEIEFWPPKLNWLYQFIVYINFVYLLFIIYYLLFIIYYLLLIIYYLIDMIT